jgi:hypothetical protein
MTIVRQWAAQAAGCLRDGTLTIAWKNLREIKGISGCIFFRQSAQLQGRLDFGFAEPDFSTELSTDFVDIVSAD